MKKTMMMAAATATAIVQAASPSAPTSVSGFGIDAGVRIFFIPPTVSPAITKYQFRYKDTGSFSSWADIALDKVFDDHTTAATNDKWMDVSWSGIKTDDTEYTLQIRAVNGDGNGTATGDFTATPLPASVHNFTTTVGHFVNNGSGAHTSFTTGPNPSGYLLTSMKLSFAADNDSPNRQVVIYTNGSGGEGRRGTEIGKLYGPDANLKNGANHYVNKTGISLSPNTKYWAEAHWNEHTGINIALHHNEASPDGWTIGNGVYNGSGFQLVSGTNSLAFSVTALPKAPTTPELSVLETDGAVRFSWRNYGGFARQQIQRKPHGQNWENTWTTLTSLGTGEYAVYNRTGLTNGQAYGLRFRAINRCQDTEANCTSPTAELFATPRAATVKNLGQGDASGGEESPTGGRIAGSFTTGSSNRGFTLDSVVIDMDQVGPAGFKTRGIVEWVAIYTDSSGNPGTEVARLGGDRSINSHGVYIYDAARGSGNHSLSGGTTYWVVVQTGTDDKIQLNSTTADNQDSGGSTGWSIGNDIQERGPSSNTWTTVNEAMKMAVYATRVIPPPTAPKTVGVGYVDCYPGNDTTRCPASATNKPGVRLHWSPPVEPVSVSNIGENQPGGDPGTFNGSRAMSFITGNHSGGYVLNAATVALSPGTVSSVKVHRDSSGNPGAEVGTLTGPGTIGGSGYANFRYTSAGGIPLDAATRYWLVVTGNVGFGRTESSNQTNSPNNAGWVIPLESRRKTGSEQTWTGWSTAVARFSVEASYSVTTGFTGYQYRYKSGTAGYTSWTDAGTGRRSWYDVGSLTAGTPYSFQIRAKGSAALSPPITAVTGTPAAPIVSNLNQARTHTKNIALSGRGRNEPTQQPIATWFETGPIDAPGNNDYTLHAVSLRIGRYFANEAANGIINSVKIYANTGTGNNSRPTGSGITGGTLVGVTDITGADNENIGNITFTSLNGVQLQRNTRYWVVIDAGFEFDMVQSGGNRDGNLKVPANEEWEIGRRSQRFTGNGWEDGSGNCPAGDNLSCLGMHMAINATPNAGPAAPTAMTALGTDGGAQFGWTVPAGAVSYEYRYKGGSQTNFTSWAAAPTGGSATSRLFLATDTLTNGTRYTYQFRAVGTGGNGAASAEATVTPQVPIVTSLATTDGQANTMHDGDFAYSFTTGGNVTDYSLSAVRLKIAATTSGGNPVPTAIDVDIYSDSSNAPGTKLTGGDLTVGPTPINSSTLMDYTYAFPGGGTIRLTRNTRYWIVIRGNLVHRTTTATLSVNSAGFTIHRRIVGKAPSDSTWTSQNNTRVGRFDIYAAVNPETVQMRLRVFLEGPLR